MTELEPANVSVVVYPTAPPVPHYTDADFTVSRAAADRLINAPAENTKIAHARDWAEFEKWCGTEGRMALPATAQTFLTYVTHLIETREPPLSPASVDRAMGTIRAKHAASGYQEQPPIRPSRAVLRAYRRQWAEEGNRTRKATPVKVDALQAMLDTCDPETPAGLRDRAILLLGFAMMARRSELSGLNLADIRPAAEGLDVLVSHSKTDQDAKGQTVPVLAGGHPESCPVRAVQTWMALLAGRGITEGALFRPIDRHGRIGDEPGAAGHPRDRLSGHAIADIVHRHALAAGLKDPSGYERPTEMTRWAFQTLRGDIGNTDIRGCLQREGYDLTPEQIRGAIKYLSRQGEIVNVSYGKWRLAVSGAAMNGSG